MSSAHEQWMQIALEEARKGYGYVSPNPLVGAVVVRDGKILGRGYHHQCGMPHAEVEAVRNAEAEGYSCEGAEIYVTLEPCCTYGKTPPCTELICSRKFSFVSIGTLDPNPAHAGRALKIFDEHGIKYEVGVCEKECRELNRIFFKYITSDRPYVLLKMGITLDGKIATAHTADDNAETVLMHLIRGTGLRGLGGITPMRQGNVIRPMLTVTRKEVLALLEEYYIPYRVDSSNETDDFLRNRLRHHVMPLLLKENPRLVENFAEMIKDLRGDEAALSCLAKAGLDVPVSQLTRMPHALRRRWLKDFLERNGVKEPERSHILLAENLVFSEKPSARADFPGGVTVARCYDCLRVVTAENALETIPISVPGVTEAGAYRIICRPAEKIINTTDTFTVAVQGKVTLRSRMTGDEIRLSGGTKTLKKLFIDKKIPASERNQVPVLADESGILAVYGIGPHQDRISQDLPAVQITIEKIGEI